MTEDPDEDDGAALDEPEAHADTPPDGRDAEHVIVPLYLQIPLLVIAIAFMLHSAFPIKFEWQSLNAGPVTLAWLGLLAVFALLHLVSKINLPGGGGLELRAIRAADKAIASSYEYSDLSVKYANQMASWLNTAALLNETLIARDKLGADADSINQVVTRFCLERMEEARDLLATGGEKMRVAVFWYTDAVHGLQISLSNDIRDEQTLQYVFEPGEGLLGEAFLESRLYNLKDVRHYAFFIPVIKMPDYRGLLIVPIRRANRTTVGMVTIDRDTAEYFTPEAEAAGWSLADLISYAYAHPITQKYLPAVMAGSEPKLGLG